MAAKVNKTVVIALVLGVVCVVAGVMFMMTFVLRSGADLALQGDRLMEAGKHDEAASAYSKAVNKDQNNVEYIEKWAKALSSQTPTSLQAYSDRYRQWLSTQRLIANVKRVDPAAHRAVLDMVLSDARISPRAGPVWQMLESDSSDIIARMKDEPQEKIDQIRRYRGIATVGKMGQSLEVSAEDRARAKDDLLTAMKIDPSDALAAVYYADLMRLSADKLRSGINEDDADSTIAEGLATMQAFCAKNPTSTVARLGLLQLEVADLTARARKNPSATADFQAQIKPKMEALLATLESEDPAKVDEFVATQVLDTVVREKVTDAVERGAKVFERMVAAKPDQPFARLMMARFNATTDSPRKAADEFKKIMDLPNQPVSPAGLALFGVRDSAAVQRVDALIALTERQKTPADRAAALAETKAARDELRARSTVDDAPKTLIDAKIALLSNDSAEARKLLGQYHQSTSYSDPAALMLSARVLYSQGLKGEAKTMLVRILDRRMGNPEVFKMLCQIDSELNNLPSALNWSEQGLAIAPKDTMLIAMKEQLENSIRNVGNTDPLQRTLAEMKNAILLSPPDLEVVKAKGLVALPLCTKPEHFVEVARLMRRVGREEGLGAANRGLEKFPTDATLLAMSKRFMITDPLKEELDRIDSDANLSPVEKELGRYFAYGQTGKNKEAYDALGRAAAVDPEHPLVVAGLFEQAMAEGKLDRAAELAQKAKEKNLDKADGRIYAARLAEAQGRFTDAIPLLERASEIDRLNPLTWRYLGNAYLAVNDKAKALASFARSLQIKPDDVATINSHIQCLMSMDRTTEALSAAREASRMGISQPGFIQLWLLLEFRAGDKDLALDRRAFILRTDPDNIDNALEYAKCLIEVRRLAEARQVMDGVEKAAKTPELTKALELPLGMLKAALRGAGDDSAGALADFEALAATLPEERRESAYIEFSNIVGTLSGTNTLVVSVLDAGRKYQDYKPANAAADQPPLARIDRMLGDVYFSSSQWDLARAAYQRARDTVPEDTDKLLLKRIIECRMKAQQFDEARKLLDAEGGDRSTDLQILLLAAQLELARGDRPKALEILDRAQATAPQSALPYRQRGVLKMDDPRTIDDAIVDFELAVGIEPRNTDLVILLARAYLRKGDASRAEGALQKGLAIQPDSAALRNEQVQQLMSQNRPKEAMDALDAAIKADPLNTRWPLVKGVILQRANDQRSAALEYEKAWKIRKGPDTGKALADAYIGAYDLSSPKDRTLLDKALAVINDPAMGTASEPMSRLSRMSLSLRQDRRADALNDLRSVVTDPKVNLNETQSGVVIIDELRRAFSGDMKLAGQMLDEVRPASGWPDIFTLTILRARLGDATLRDGAMADLDALTRSSNTAAAIGAASTLGANAYIDGVNAAKKPNNTAEVNRHYERAVRAFQTGLELDPDSTELNNNMAFILAKGLNRPAEALPRALKAAAKDPNNPNILDTLGAIQLLLDDTAKSEETLNRALGAANDPVTRTMPLIHMIEVKLKKGDRQAADDLFRELTSLEATDARVKSNYHLDIEEIGKRMKPNP